MKLPCKELLHASEIACMLVFSLKSKAWLSAEPYVLLCYSVHWMLKEVCTLLYVDIFSMIWNLNKSFVSLDLWIAFVRQSPSIVACTQVIEFTHFHSKCPSAFRG